MAEYYARDPFVRIGAVVREIWASTPLSRPETKINPRWSGEDWHCVVLIALVLLRGAGALTPQECSRAMILPIDELAAVAYREWDKPSDATLITIPSGMALGVEWVEAIKALRNHVRAEIARLDAASAGAAPAQHAGAV
jgi:hypothetical protein